MNKQIKIGHYSDIQVFLTEDISYDLTEKILDNVTSTFEKSGVDGIVCAGDIFDKHNPKDSERTLIYQHFSNILKLPNVKFFAVLLGNHDYLDSSKTKDIYSDTNPIDTWHDILKNIAPELRNKLVYLKEQKPYELPEFNIVLYPYSLEDGSSNGNNIRAEYISSVDYNKLNITVHHDINYEYVEEAKLPLNQRKKDSLVRVNSDDFFTDIILGGDIHQYHIIHGNEQYPDRKYFYTGNVYELNFGEGCYSFIRRNTRHEPTYNRCINIHTFEDNKLIKTETSPLEKMVGHLTIDVNTNTKIENLGEQLKGVLQAYNTATHTNFFRFKLAQMYAPIENKLRDFVLNFYHESDAFKANPFIINVEFIYDKKSITNNNDVVETMKLNTLNTELESNNITQNEYDLLKKVIIDNVDIESAKTELGLDDIEFDELISGDNFSQLMRSNMAISDMLNADNVDESLSNIILTNDKIIEIFKLQLNKLKPTILKSIGDTKKVDEIVNEVTTRFISELGKSMTDTSQYTCTLLEVYCNFFCQLGENRIQLDNIGLTRINGTNGVGKTTLYNMIRWILTGVLFPHLKANQIVRNTGLVFNMFDPSKDDLTTELKFNISGKSAKITRTAKRVWKSSATKNEDLKHDTNWIEYVQTIERNLILEFDGNTYYNDVAQELINKWFGDVIDTTMIVDKFTIPNMLNRGGSDLRGLVMEHLAPYLDVLESDLKNIKEQYNVVKPIKTMTQIASDRLQNDGDIVTADKAISGRKMLINSIEKSLAELSELQTKNKEDLITLGDVHLAITESEKEVEALSKTSSDLTEIITEFEPKELPTFTDKEPIKDIEKIDCTVSTIDTFKSTIDTYETNLKTVNIEVEKRTEIIRTEHTEMMNGLREDMLTQFDGLSGKLNTTIDKIKERKTVAETEYKTFENELEIEFNNRVNILDNNVKELNTELVNLVLDLNKANDDITNSFCPECKRDFEETDTAHIDKLNEKIEELKVKQIDVSTRLNTAKTNHLNYKNDGVKSVLNEDEKLNERDKELSSNLTKATALQSHPMVINLIAFKDEIITRKINSERNLDELLSAKLIDETIKTDYESLIEFIKESKAKADVNLLIGSDKDLIESGTVIDSIKLQIEASKSTLETLQKELDLMNNTYNDELLEYNKNLKKYNEDLIEVNNHNTSIHDKKAKLDSINKLLETEQNKLDKSLENLKTYDDLREDEQKLKTNINTLNVEINTLNTEINTLKIDINKYENIAMRLDEIEQDNIDYLTNSLIYSTYETMIKKLFKSDIFSYYKEFLNSTLNLLLEDSKFKLVWYEDGELYYNEIRDGRLVSIPVVMVSGMQTIFCGLSLIFTLSLLNTKTNINVMFIDEISGSLNNGKGLKHTTNIVDYQDQLILLLHKFKNKSVYMVDHVIDNLFETESYEVIAKEGGSIYVKQGQ